MRLKSSKQKAEFYSVLSYQSDIPPLFVRRSDAFHLKYIKSVGERRCSTGFSSDVYLLSCSFGTFQTWLKVWLMFEQLTVHLYKPASFIFKGAAGCVISPAHSKQSWEWTDWVALHFAPSYYSLPSLLHQSALTSFYWHAHTCRHTHIHTHAEFSSGL